MRSPNRGRPRTAKVTARTALITATIVGLAAAPAAATHEGRTTPARDFVVGAGENIFNTQFSLDISSGPIGQRPRGRFRFRVPDLPPPLVNRGRPTCLRVEGGRATIGGRLKHPLDTPAGPMGGVLITVTDGDHPEVGALPEGVTFNPVASPPETCPPPLPAPDDALTRGGVAVHDGEPRRPCLRRNGRTG